MPVRAANLSKKRKKRRRWDDEQEEGGGEGEEWGVLCWCCKDLSVVSKSKQHFPPFVLSDFSTRSVSVNRSICVVYCVLQVRGSFTRNLGISGHSLRSNERFRRYERFHVAAQSALSSSGSQWGLKIRQRRWFSCRTHVYEGCRDLRDLPSMFYS